MYREFKKLYPGGDFNRTKTTMYEFIAKKNLYPGGDFNQGPISRLQSSLCLLHHYNLYNNCMISFV